MQQRSKQTHERIISVALQLFSEQGYERTGVDHICKVAGISKGAFYHHFPGKHALFLELLNSWLFSVQTQIDHRFVHGKNIADGFAEISGSLNEIIGDSGKNLPVLFEFWQQSIRKPELWDKATAPFHHYKEHFRSFINRGMDNKEIEVQDPELITNTLLAFSFGVIASSMIDPQQDWEKTAAYGFAAFFEKLKRSEI